MMQSCAAGTAERLAARWSTRLPHAAERVAGRDVAGATQGGRFSDWYTASIASVDAWPRELERALAAVDR